jgi:protein-L-isoaspartate(D-aspartate) O-methyltransferase
MQAFEERQQERSRMVEHQLRQRGIKDPRLLAVMERVPRHRFLPDPDDPGAYDDHPLPIGQGQTISQPYMVALMTECLAPGSQDRLLEIGAGSGYQAAVLAELAAEVYSVERHEPLADRARRLLAELGYDNLHIVLGDGTLGHPEAAPYDGIVVTAAAPIAAKPWLDQLAEGGRLVVPIGDRFGQMLTLFRKKDDQVSRKEVCGCVFVPLIGAHGWKS